jgi:hypothetical protein
VSDENRWREVGLNVLRLGYPKVRLAKLGQRFPLNGNPVEFLELTQEDLE